MTDFLNRLQAEINPLITDFQIEEIGRAKYLHVVYDYNGKQRGGIYRLLEADTPLTGAAETVTSFVYNVRVNGLFVSKEINNFEQIIPYAENICFDHAEDEHFSHALRMLDTSMDSILSCAWLHAFRSGTNDIPTLAGCLSEQNPNKISESRKRHYYRYKLQSALFEFLLSIKTDGYWDGKITATDGIIVRHKDGHLQCHPLGNIEELIEYLYNNVVVDLSPDNVRLFPNQKNGQCLTLDFQLRLK